MRVRLVERIQILNRPFHFNEVEDRPVVDTNLRIRFRSNVRR